MIAMALACRPELIIADEPTTALDVTTEVRILDLLNQLQKELGVAVLYISHDLGVVRKVSHRVLVMYAGRVVEMGPTERLFREPKHPYTAGCWMRRPPRNRLGGPSGHRRNCAGTPRPAAFVPVQFEMSTRA